MTLSQPENRDGREIRYQDLLRRSHQDYLPWSAWFGLAGGSVSLVIGFRAHIAPPEESAHTLMRPAGLPTDSTSRS